MTASIAVDHETEQLAQRLAQAAGLPVETIVRDAIIAKATAAGLGPVTRQRLTGQALIERMQEISDHCASLPILDPRTPDEIIGYDEHGLPA